MPQKRDRDSRADVEVASGPTIGAQLPIFDDSELSSNAAIRFYRDHQILHVRCKADPPIEHPIDGIHAFFGKRPDLINEYWSVENKGGVEDEADLSASSFFEMKMKSSSSAKSKSKSATSKAISIKDCGSFYISCILQKDQQQLDAFLERYPHSTPPFVEEKVWSGFRQTKPVWVFIGQHLGEKEKKGGKGEKKKKGGKGGKQKQKQKQKETLTQIQIQTEENMKGRDEHTDSVSHDGTWHYQISGRKVWHVRPGASSEWLNGAGTPVLEVGVSAGTGAGVEQRDTKKRKGKQISSSSEPDKDGDKNKPPSLRIECETGDILMVNTRLWFHCTEIPCTKGDPQQVSASFARDFYCSASRLQSQAPSSADAAGQGQFCQVVEPEPEEEEAAYTNRTGLYASSDIRQGQVLFLAADMPDAELPRSSRPNCEVTWDEGGELRALEDISMGTWLAIAPSDEESEGEWEEEEGDNDGEEGKGEGF